MKRSRTHVLITFAAFVAIVATTCSGVLWLLDNFELKTKFGALIYIWLVVCTGIVAPSLLVSFVWLFLTFRETDRAETEAEKHKQDAQSLHKKLNELAPKLDLLDQMKQNLTSQVNTLVSKNKDLESQLNSMRRDIVSGASDAAISSQQLVVHLLDECLINVQLIATEMQGEHGPRFTKAKEQQSRTLQVYMKLCRSRFTRDLQLLERIDPTDASGARQTFASLKRGLLTRCEEIERNLSARASNNEEAKLSLEIAGSKLGQYMYLFQQEIHKLTKQVSTV